MRIMKILKPVQISAISVFILILYSSLLPAQHVVHIDQVAQAFELTRIERVAGRQTYKAPYILVQRYIPSTSFTVHSGQMVYTLAYDHLEGGMVCHGRRPVSWMNG